VVPTRGNLHPNGPECCPIRFRELRTGLYPRSRMNTQPEFDSERRGERTVILDDNEEELKGERGAGIESQQNCGASCAKKLLTITLVCNIIIILTRHVPWILILSFNPPSSKKHMQPDNVSHFWTFFCCHFNNRRPQLMYFITFSASRL